MQGGAAAIAARFDRDAPAAAASFKAPLLERLLDHGEDPAPRIVVLDLGPASQALLDRVSANRPCRVEIADFPGHGAVEVLSDPDVLEAAGEKLITSLLPKPNAEPLELILCWDLPNYLSLAALELLFDTLGRRAAPACKLHMLVAYSKRDMPARPARYVSGEDGHLTQMLISSESAAAPRYSPEDLGRAVGRFEYERGVLLANGMQEFVYAWPDEPGAERPF